MGASGKKQTKRARRASSTRLAAGAGAGAPASLARTAVFKRVPASVRRQLDKAILLKPDTCPTLDAIARKLKLSERYGITAKALQSYACRLEELVRPVLTSHLIAGVLGCLPKPYRERLVAGSQVLLLSRIAQALNTENEKKHALPVTDLGKLATILSAVARQTTTACTRTAGARTKRTRETKSKNAHVPLAVTDPSQMAEAVSMLYGLDWPPDAEKPGPRDIN